MKKFLFLFLSLVLLAACGSDTNEEQETSAKAPLFLSVTPTTDTEISAGEQTFVLTFDRNITILSSTVSQITLNGKSVTSAKIEGGASPRLAVTATVPDDAAEAALVIPAGIVKTTSGGLAARTELKWNIKQRPAVNPSAFDGLCNPKATPEAQRVMEFLKENYGKFQLSGVQSSSSNTLDFVNAVADRYGKHPALAGFDFIYLAFSPTPEGWSWQQNYNDISAAREQWEHNGLISYMWHWNVPDNEAAYLKCRDEGSTDHMGFYAPGCNGGQGETQFDIREALKEGTWQHECILRDIDEVAGYLLNLQEANIPVIFRPLHEAAGSYTRYFPQGGAWFWWGRYGAEPCRQLYRLLYDRLVNHHGLNNLIWCWTIDVAEGYEKSAKEWYPGDDCVDIVGADIYTDSPALCQRTAYDFMHEVTDGKKLTTVSECGNICNPTAQQQGGAFWSWFMVWPTTGNGGTIDLAGWKANTASYWQEVLQSPCVMNREDMPSLKAL